MCLCSRIGGGRVVRSPGLKKRGFVAGDNLQAWKARILFSLALSKTTDAGDFNGCSTPTEIEDNRSRP